jgi:hypothetical protein
MADQRQPRATVLALHDSLRYGLAVSALLPNKLPPRALKAKVAVALQSESAEYDFPETTQRFYTKVYILN